MVIDSIGYLGPPGTFSNQAASQISKQAYPYPSFPEIINAVESNEVRWGLLPLENSIEGAVTETMDLLLELNSTNLIKEVVLPIKYNLLVTPGVDVTNIQTVLSHPQALAQCKELFRLYPHLSQLAVKSTAEAAKEAAKTKDKAALSPSLCQKLYSLQSLWEGPKAEHNNKTRFVVLGQEETDPTGNDCTSIAFGTSDVPGGLYSPLKAFYEESINLSRIESRPSKKQLGEYIFFVDFEGHVKETRVKRTINKLHQVTTFYKLLGSYQRDD